jgi:hypothetical protein
MAGTTIGEVNISLRMNLAQFKNDVKDGTDTAAKATKDMSQTMSGNITEARGTLTLLGDEIGVHIPRHLQTFIAQIPGVGTALNAAFSSVAVLALLEVLIRAIEKIQEWRQHLEDSRIAWLAVGAEGVAALHKQEEEILALQIQIDNLTQDHLAALRGELKLIDAQTFDSLKAAILDIQKTVDAGFKSDHKDFFIDFFKDSNQYVDAAKKDMDDFFAHVQELSDKQDTEGVKNALVEKTKELNRNLALPADAQNRDTRIKAFQDELNAVTNLSKQYDNLNDKRAKKDDIANTTERNRLEAEALAQQNTDLSQLQEIKKIRDDEQAKLNSSLQNEIKGYSDKIAKVREYKAAWEEAHGGIDAIANQEIEQLTREKAVIQSLIDAQNKILALGVVPGVQQKAPDFSEAGQAAGFGGTSDQLKLAKIKTDATYAKEVAQQERDAAETVNEKYQGQVALLKELNAQGLLVGKDYEDAMAKATAAADKGNHAWAQFGQEVGANILAAAEMKESWGQALASILEDLLKVILQMEVMKALSSVGGGGGFGSIIGSLFGGHRAMGGPVYGDQSYLVGENGPEMFTPGASGRITPNGAMGGGTTINNYIDARGAQAGVSDEIRDALRQTENRAVARAVVTSREIQLRRSS